MNVYGYKVNIKQRCVSEERSTEQFGSWHKSYSNAAPSYIEKEDKYPDVLSTYDCENGDVVILVWIEYSTGDSFGKPDRGSAEAIGVFTDMKAAKELKNHITKQADDNKDGYCIKTSDGQVFQSDYAPWNGYFEKLEEVHLSIAEVR